MSVATTPSPIAVMIGQLTQGGSERQMYYFLSHCDRERWSPHVVVSGELGYWEQPIRDLGIAVTLLHGSQAAKLRQLRSLCVAGRIRHFFSWSSYTNGFALALTGLGARRVGSFRNYGFADLPERRRQLWQWLSLAGISTAVCNSQATVAQVQPHLGKGQQAVFVPNCVEAPADPGGSRRRWRDTLAVCDDDVLVVGVGRLTPQKNFGRFVDAIAAARQHMPVRAVIAGQDFGCRAQLERQRDSLGIEPGALRFLGPVGDARELICAADVLLLTSDYEGTPNVVLEAMAAGVPVVCTSASNGGEVLDDGCEGFVTAPVAAELADRVLRIAGNPALAQTMRAAARERAQRDYDPRATAQRLWALCAA